MNPTIAAYFRELIGRVAARSPVFFVIFKNFTAGLTLAGYIPKILCDYFNVEMPPHFIRLCTDIGNGAIGAFLTSFLPAQSPPVALKENGELLKQTDEKKMPFTKMCEQRQKDKLTDMPLFIEPVAIRPEESSILKPTPPEAQEEE